jgi:hypothetical protein
MNQMRWIRRAAVLAITISFALNACRGSSTAPTHQVQVRTAQPVYQIAPAATFLPIEATLTNAMDESLLLDGLGRDFQRLEKRVGGSWRLAYSPIHILPLVPDIELPAGESRKLTIGLYLGQAPNTFPRFEYDIPGTYRAVFAFRAASGKGFDVYSNAFELRADR